MFSICFIRNSKSQNERNPSEPTNHVKITAYLTIELPNIVQIASRYSEVRKIDIFVDSILAADFFWQ